MTSVDRGGTFYTDLSFGKNCLMPDYTNVFRAYSYSAHKFVDLVDKDLSNPYTNTPDNVMCAYQIILLIPLAVTLDKTSRHLSTTCHLAIDQKLRWRQTPSRDLSESWVFMK